MYNSICIICILLVSVLLLLLLLLWLLWLLSLLSLLFARRMTSAPLLLYHHIFVCRKSIYLYSSLMHMIISLTSWVSVSRKALIHRERSCHQDDCCPCWWWDWTGSHGWDSEGRMAHKSCQIQLASCCMKINVSYSGFSYAQPWKIRKKPAIGSPYILFIFPSKLFQVPW